MISLIKTISIPQTLATLRVIKAGGSTNRREGHRKSQDTPDIFTGSENNLERGNMMKTVAFTSTDQTTQQNSEEEVMSNTAISAEFTKAQEKGLAHVSIAAEGNMMSLESREDEEKSNHREYSLAVELISSILAVLTGLLVYKVTGLYDGVNSMFGKIILGTVISFCYLSVFRHAMYKCR
jgi:F0F1-type ATP synthase assembly protein I